ncbi:MAG: rhamnan synthesis F family protein [Xanthobacteraceae bacterium]
MSEPDIIPPKGPPRTPQQQALAGLRLRPGKNALSENPIIFAANQYAPLNLKRLIPRPLVEFIRRLLSPRVSPSPAPASIPAAVQRDSRFDWLGPFFASVGLDGEPEAVFAALSAAGYPVYDTLSAAERVAGTVRESALFDEQFYRLHVPGLGQLDPALHYVIVGERMGFSPSEGFDPAYYNDRNPNLGRACLLAHYVTHGKRQGRRPISAATTITIDTSRIDPTRETILVVSHEASRTGAPILAYNIVKRLSPQYNVVTILLSGGNIVPAFAKVSTSLIGPLDRKDWHPVEMDYLVRRLVRHFQFSYALVNSIDARLMMKPLSMSFVPVVALIHEFASHLKPPGEMADALSWATKVVFSAERVFDSVRAESPEIDDHRVHILPQGPPELPPVENENRASVQTDVQSLVRPAGHENDFVVLGCGTISPRKGVDLFLACVAAVMKRKSPRRVRFVWIGQYLPKDIDSGYSRKLRRYVRWSGISGSVAILDEVADLEPAYRQADAFFLSSRLDPLPNVAIDSALRELPVVCFAECSGIADILKTDATAGITVVPKLDVEAAANLIVELSANEQKRQAIGQASRALALAKFDMDAYVARLAAIGRDARSIMQQRREDFATIERDDSFDLGGFLGLNFPTTSREEAINMFVAEAAIPKAGPYFSYRRPSVGFHPHVYAFENKGRYDATLINPLGHFIRSGKAEGAWKSEVISPVEQDRETAPSPIMKVGMHVHFHYPELCAELLALIASNRSRCDLLLTTNTARKARVLETETAGYQRGKVEIMTTPNRGRDIGAFLTGLGQSFRRYDVLGHLHSKRSLFLTDRTIGERWRQFIWANLVGHEHAMMDIVLDRMARDARLGLVFPDDPHLSAWDENLEIAEQLAQRMGIRAQLPPFFNFPLGTMFWARTQALAPLFELGLDWPDYPVEPAPIDGTILHALERLLPFVTQHQGYKYATTHVPGVTW